jgi:nitrite reductase/ring-hydroxylating ferredoxin subunit
VAQPSVHAQVCDLLGFEPDKLDDRARPTVAQALARCSPGQVVPARRGSRRVAVVMLDDGRCFEVPDRCPHDGAPISDGFVDGDRLVCARHGWEFDLESGLCPGRGRVAIDSARLCRLQGRGQRRGGG